jgi:hypothetical protein
MGENAGRVRKRDKIQGSTLYFLLKNVFFSLNSLVFLISYLEYCRLILHSYQSWLTVIHREIDLNIWDNSICELCWGYFSGIMIICIDEVICTVNIQVVCIVFSSIYKFCLFINVWYIESSFVVCFLQRFMTSCLETHILHHTYHTYHAFHLCRCTIG